VTASQVLTSRKSRVPQGLLLLRCHLRTPEHNAAVRNALLERNVAVEHDVPGVVLLQEATFPRKNTPTPDLPGLTLVPRFVRDQGRGRGQGQGQGQGHQYQLRLEFLPLDASAQQGHEPILVQEISHMTMVNVKGSSGSRNWSGTSRKRLMDLTPLKIVENTPSEKMRKQGREPLLRPRTEE
jgi:hypothetical protein